MVDAPSQPSPATHSGRLVYANARDLPSYPSAGLRADGAAAGAAASLGWAKQKPVELWKPNKTPCAFAAAALAKDYKMAPAWEPAADSAGARAAVLAHGAAATAGRIAAQQESPKSPGLSWGSSAATQAFHSSAAPSPRHSAPSHGSSAATQAFNTSRSLSMRKPDASPSAEQDSQRSLAAAKGAMSVRRPRAATTPSTGSIKELYPGQSAATANALNGAALAHHRASMKASTPVGDSGAVPVTTMARNMFTSHPAVKPEIDEQANRDKLHASAVAMARKIYTQQQKILDQTKEAHDDGSRPGQAGAYVNLQDAAYKQAHDRLSKLHDEHQKNRDYQEYYGNTPAPRRRFSMGSKLRRRRSSDPELADREQSEKIREQMSMFSNSLSKVDQNKRQQDRDAVLAAAHRNVKAQLQSMEEKAWHEKGKAPHHAKLPEWELKAQQAAQARHDSRTEHKGKLNIGGGMFMDPSEVNAIAAMKVQPVLDDINHKAEVERERQTAMKMEEEAKKAAIEKDKARDRETKDINKKLKDQEKQEERAKRQQEKQEEKSRKEEERAAKAEEKRLATEEKRQAKEEKRRSKRDSGKDVDRTPAQASTAVQTPAPAQDSDHSMESDDSSEDQFQEVHDSPANVIGGISTSNATAEEKSADASTSPTSKVKGWIKNRFSRGRSITEGSDKKKGFVGGAALRNSEANDSSISVENGSASLRDVAMAGKNRDTGDAARDTARDSGGVSPISTPDEELAGQSRDRRSLGITPPKPIEDPASRPSSSPTRDSRFREMMDR